MKRPFKSFLAPLFDEFIMSRQAAGQWCKTYEENLHYFDNHIARKYPDADLFTEGMTSWCDPRRTETGQSCRVRTTVVWNFVDYARKRGMTQVGSRRIKANGPSSYVPHYFTHGELVSFFDECDNRMLNLSLRHRSLSNLLNRLELPVFFRLLLSSGMRTCEARWLKCRDVDLETGVVSIEKSKGAGQHRVVLHESILFILRKYDEAVSKLMPRREHFFPDRNGRARPAAWEGYHFRNIWGKISAEPACAYDLRSHYAVTNITKWENHGYELSGKLLFLSRSMGHKSIQSTFGYFHITPMLTDKLKKNTGNSFNNLLPKLQDYGNL